MIENKFYYINPSKLKEALSSKNITHNKVAKLIGVSTKSIQRLINGTSLKIKADNLIQLSQILEIDQKNLIIGDDDGIRIKPANLLIKALTSDCYFHRVAANQDWDNYIKTLRYISPLNLPNNQEVLLHFRLGLSLLATGAISSGVKSLEEGKQKSLHIKDWIGHMKTSCALSYYYIPNNDFNDNLSRLQDIREQYSHEFNSLEKAFLYKSIGLTLLYTNQLSESINYLRKSIRLAYEDKSDSFLRVAFSYQYLGLAYLRNKNLEKAKSTYEKTRTLASQSGWSQGTLLADLYLALIEVITGKRTSLPLVLLRKAKNASRHTDYETKLQFKHFEFLNWIFTDQYENAVKSYSEARELAKSSDYLSAYSILDGLFLEKISGMKSLMAFPEIREAQNIFLKNNLHEDFKNVEWLQGLERISKNDFIRRYHHLD